LEKSIADRKQSTYKPVNSIFNKTFIFKTNEKDNKCNFKKKSKEEKETRYAQNTNESLQLGLNVMDSYFDRLSVNEPEQEDEPNKQDDIIVYETKDPYVLRSLPYLIGSQLYMENDHVGLNDLEEESEQEESKSESELEESITQSVKSNKSASKIEESTFDKFDELMKNETKNNSKKASSEKDNESDIFDVEHSEESANTSESSNDIFETIAKPKSESTLSKIPDLFDQQEESNEEKTKKAGSLEIKQKSLIETLNSKFNAKKADNIFSLSDEEDELFNSKTIDVKITLKNDI